MALLPLAVDVYLPAFPDIAKDLNVSVHEIALSISFYIFALACGQLVAGPLSDRFGRQRVMLTGLAIFAVSSLLVAQSSSLTELLIFRACQAFGGGWAAVCVPAMVRDRLSGNEAARLFSLIGLIMISAPAIAPSLGSALLHFFGWTSIFIVLSIYSVIVLILLKLVIFNVPHKQPPFDPSINVWSRYKAVLQTRPAMRFMLLQGMVFSVMMIFISHASFIYQGHFGVSANEFSLLFGANIVLMMVINLINRALLKHYPPERLLRYSLSLQGVGILLLIVVSVFSNNLWLFLAAMMITVGSMGAISPNIQAVYMEYFTKHGGTAAALLGATQFSMAGLLSAATALLPESLISIVFAQAACSAICLLLIFTHHEKPKPQRTQTAPHTAPHTAPTLPNTEIH